jgi:hypothetical protein
MDYSVLVALGGGVVGGLITFLAIGLAGCVTLAINARGFSELT